MWNSRTGAPGAGARSRRPPSSFVRRRPSSPLPAIGRRHGSLGRTLNSGATTPIIASLLLPAPYRDRHVVSAEPERIRQRDVHRPIHAPVVCVIQVALRGGSAGI